MRSKTRAIIPTHASCRGLRILVEMLDEDYSENKTLILSSLEGIGSVFDLQVSQLKASYDSAYS